MIRKILLIFSCIIGAFISILFIFFIIISIFYQDNNKPNDLDFIKNDITEMISVSEKDIMISQVTDLVRNHVDPVFLQYVYITTFIVNGKTEDAIIECTYNTYNKEAEEYGKIFVVTNFLTGKVEAIKGSYGYQEEIDTLLETDKQLIDNLDELNHYFRTALQKMKKVNKDNLNYSYEIVFEKNNILINTSQENFIYDKKTEQFKSRM